MKNTTRTIPAKTRAMVAEQLNKAATPEIHPAQKAGAAVHQAVENGLATAAETVAVGFGYAAGFIKGLVKGH